MTQDEIIRMAREAGIGALTEYGKEALERFAALVAAHEREKQAEQEPVAWIGKGGFNTCGEGQPLYAAPVRTKDLTDDEIDEIFAEYGTIPHTKAVRAVIQEYRRKNGIV